MVLVRVTILQGRRSAQQNLTTGIIGNIFAEPWYDISCADPGWEPVAAVQIRALTVNPKIHPPLALHCENTTPTGIGCTRIDRDLPGCEARTVPLSRMGNLFGWENAIREPT